MSDIGSTQNARPERAAVTVSATIDRGPCCVVQYVTVYVNHVLFIHVIF